MRSYGLKAFVSACALAAAGCATVPRQAVTLSTVVGARISDLQASHEQAISAYFQLARERVESFLENRWIPEFLGEFVRTSDVTGKLSNVRPLSDEQTKLVVAELDKASVPKSEQGAILGALNSAFGDPDRGKLLLQFSQAAVAQIELRRRSLIDPINALEKQALDQLRQAYAELIQAQSTVTANLESVQKVTDAQDNALERLGVLRQRDEALQKAISANDTIVGIINKGKGALDTIKDLENAVKPPAAAPAAATP